MKYLKSKTLFKEFESSSKTQTNVMLVEYNYLVGQITPVCTRKAVGFTVT